MVAQESGSSSPRLPSHSDAAAGFSSAGCCPCVERIDFDISPIIAVEKGVSHVTTTKSGEQLAESTATASGKREKARMDSPA
jgi:hypothetical protein